MLISGIETLIRQDRNIFVSDNPKELQFQASLMLGFSDTKAMGEFFKSESLKKISDKIAYFCSAVHAYEIKETLTYVKDGKILTTYQH